MDQITHTVRSYKRKDIILQCQKRPAGMSVKQWMTENQVSEKSYYYWQRKLRTEAFEQMNHSPLLPAVLIEKDGNIEQSKLEPLMPWSKSLPVDCYSKRRK